VIAGLNITIAGGPLQEFVVGGFTEGKGTRLKSFGALLLGGYRDGKLRYFGHSGSGFSEKGLQDRFRRCVSFGTDIVYEKLNMLELIWNNDFRFGIKTIVLFQLNMNDLCCDVLHNEINFVETVDRSQAVRSARTQTILTEFVCLLSGRA